MNAYFGKTGVENIYETFNGGRRGVTEFMKQASQIATKNKQGFQEFRNEEALWKLIQKRFPESLEEKGICDWGHLMQYIS